MDQNFWDLLARGGITLIILVLISVYSLAVILERLWFYRKTKTAAKHLEETLDKRINQGKWDDVFVACDTAAPNYLASIYKAGLQEYRNQRLSNPAAGNPHPAPAGLNFEAIRGAMSRTVNAELNKLERWVGSLGTIGSISPFIGLFGTVIGVIKAFHAISKTGSGGLATVSAGIAEALIATAAGLAVAIPAVVTYNYFVGRIRLFAQAMDNASSRLLDALGKEVKT